MRVKALAVLALLFGTVAQSAWGQDSLVVDPSITDIVSGGHWAAAGQEGYYRIIIRTGGYEHVNSELTVEWLAERRDAGPIVVRSLTVKELRINRLDHPKIDQYLKGWRVWVQQTDTHRDPGSTRTRIIDLGVPGQLTVR
jgi:hypothetical protein